MTTIVELGAKLDALSQKVNELLKEKQVDKTESAAAKIIKDLSDRIEKDKQELISLIKSCPCGRHDDPKTPPEPTKKGPEEPGTSKDPNPPKPVIPYSYPNWNVGDEAYGSSKGPNPPSWPPRYTFN
ncbi:virion-associated protein [Eupatorium vein clearing virus]|uniref:virion-associated protein n=1 Tax=Eupatorium vein clearing virus TaxID=515444 RepID=UPI000172CAD6|nr:virion-associated protein [Eupatorium vein clearing virus]ACB69771.1 virion-associated protein [Eupatorium vein clearing virus]